MLHKEGFLHSYFRWCVFSRDSGLSFITTDELSLRVTKITSKKVVSSSTHSLSFWFYHISGNIESHNSLNLSFTNIRSFCCNLLVMNLSLNQTLLIFLIYVRQIWNTHLNLAISLWRVVFLKFKRILLLVSMVLQFMRRRDCLSTWIVLWGLWGFSYMF